MSKELKIGLDIDGVLADFAGGVINRAKEIGLGEHFPTSPSEVSYWDMSDKFSEVMRDKWRDEKFWLGLAPLVEEIPFNVFVYITSRPISSKVTSQWIKKQGFPTAPVITVDNPVEKIQHIQDLKLDIFVDDLYSTVKLVRELGVNGILMEAPYQRGHVEDCKNLPTIKRLQEIFQYVK